MREFNVIDSAVSKEQLQLRLKDTELEQYGEPFKPEFVYEAIKQLPRFVTMEHGHQQDAEEFLGFLLEGLHDECVYVLKEGKVSSTLASPTSPSASRPSTSNSESHGWFEVGPKQRSATTQASGISNSESPITKIFGGFLRSEFRVPGLKASITVEPYQALQLDISSPLVRSIGEAFDHLVKPEPIYGNFKSPKGDNVRAVKQVFIESMPPVLVLHLKRFQYDQFGGVRKLDKAIEYPLNLEIPETAFAPARRAALSRSGGLPRYRLTGVIYHHGSSAAGGHYTVDIRRQDGREWIRIDDTTIRRIREQDAVATEGPSGKGSEADRKVAYLLLYQRV